MLFKLLGAPLALPVAGLKFIFDTVAELADQELNDEQVVREQLLLLQLQLEEGEIDDDDYARQEAVLLARLRDIKARQRAEAAALDSGELPAEANVQARRRLVVETPFDDR